MNRTNLKSDLNPTRRQFLKATTAASSMALTPAAFVAPDTEPERLPAAFSALKSQGSRVQPISTQEFRGRMEHAQKLMSEGSPKFDALFCAPGSSFYYFTGIRWGVSERLLGLMLPRTGDPILVVPGFEEGRLREKLNFPAEVRVWQEDESPTQVAARAFIDRGIRTGRIGVEETAAFTFYDHLRDAAPGFECVSADPVTIACRSKKTAHELELMRLACEATFDVFRAVFASLKEGMSQDEIGKWIEAGFAKMGLRGGSARADRRIGGVTAWHDQATKTERR
jgi:Xaa-Pro aminopeptidase